MGVFYLVLMFALECWANHKVDSLELALQLQVGCLHGLDALGFLCLESLFQIHLRQALVLLVGFGLLGTS